MLKLENVAFKSFFIGHKSKIDLSFLKFKGQNEKKV